MDEKEKDYKTPEYTRRAQANYLAKKDKLQITLEKGEREKLAQVGLDNDGIRELIRSEYKRRSASASSDPGKATDDQNSKPESNDDLPEWFTSPY